MDNNKEQRFAVIINMTLNHFNNETYSLSLDDLVAAVKTEVDRGQVLENIVEIRQRVYLALFGVKYVENQDNDQCVLTECGKEKLRFNLALYKAMMEEPVPVNLDALFEGNKD